MQLNYAEKMWAAWYAYMQNDVLATGIMSFVMHELVYFGRSLPWIIADRVPWLNKYKIQNVRLPAPPILLLRLIFPFRFSAWSLRARKADS
jgi:methylsterol monooxygenase